jgi:glycerol-3-phosphate dehydrogenase
MSENYLSLLIGAEAARREASTALLKTAIDYKEHRHRVLAERTRNGTTGPEPIPHPDEVIIDHKTGGVRIEGTVLHERKEEQDRLRVMRPHIEQTLREIDDELASDPNDLLLRRTKKALTKIVDWLRDEYERANIPRIEAREMHRT